MKKNDLVLILALLLAAALLLGLSFYARSRRTDAEAPAAEEIAADPGCSDAVREAVAAFFEEYPAESYMVLTSANGVHMPVPLNEENELRLTQADGSENVIRIGKNSFCMASSNCDNQICVQEGEVTLDNRDSRIMLNMVICLPHNLKLELLSRAETEALLTELYMEAEAAGIPVGADGEAK